MVRWLCKKVSCNFSDPDSVSSAIATLFSSLQRRRGRQRSVSACSNIYTIGKERTLGRPEGAFNTLRDSMLFLRASLC